MAKSSAVVIFLQNFKANLKNRQSVTFQYPWKKGDANNFFRTQGVNLVIIINRNQLT